jgi:transcriptional regulator with XRE-family HTH domain
MAQMAGGAREEDLGSQFGARVRALRLEAGVSLNELARRAGVDPAYIHRIEARRPQRPTLPRRGVVLAIAAALGSSRHQTDQLLALAGHTPVALLELGGWDETLASVAELLGDASLSGPARAEFREMVRLLARRWARAEPTPDAPKAEAPKAEAPNREQPKRPEPAREELKREEPKLE